VVHEEYTEAKDGSTCEDLTSAADFETMEGAYLIMLSVFSSEVMTIYVYWNDHMYRSKLA
jgi:hypothetical protein